VSSRVESVLDEFQFSTCPPLDETIMAGRTIGRSDSDAVHTKTKELWTHPDIQLLAILGIRALAPNLKFWLLCR
jgi:hypothetical protein